MKTSKIFITITSFYMGRGVLNTNHRRRSNIVCNLSLFQKPPDSKMIHKATRWPAASQIFWETIPVSKSRPNLIASAQEIKFLWIIKLTGYTEANLWTLSPDLICLIRLLSILTKLRPLVYPISAMKKPMYKHWTRMIKIPSISDSNITLKEIFGN